MRGKQISCYHTSAFLSDVPPTAMSGYYLIINDIKVDIIVDVPILFHTVELSVFTFILLSLGVAEVGCFDHLSVTFS